MNDETPRRPGDRDSRREFLAVTFNLQVRQLASDVRAIEGRPGCTPDELIAIHGRAFCLLGQAPITRSDATVGWLLELRREIGAKLRVWVEEELGVGVA